MDKIIEVTHLKKSYGAVKAVKDVSFYVEKGKLFAFLGPNGAGKSTTIDMICTFLKPDEGEILIDGMKIGEKDQEIRQVIGAVFQDNMLDNLLTVRENLKIRAGLYSLSKEDIKKALNFAIKATNTEELLNRPYGKLSGGQRRRVDITRALIHSPKILFLDEPTTGLDPQTRKSVWNTIASLQNETGMTIFLTTHYMEEASLADYVVIIDDGTVVAKGTPSLLKEQYANDYVKLSYTNFEKIEEILIKGNYSFKVVSDQFLVKVQSTMTSIELIRQCEPFIHNYEVLNGTMDDVFLNITGKEIRES